MDLEYQKRLVSYLFNDRKAISLASNIDKGIVDDPALGELIGVWKSYVLKYRRSPDEIIVRRIIDREAENQKDLDQETVDDLKMTLKSVVSLEYDDLQRQDVIQYTKKRFIDSMTNELIKGRASMSSEKLVEKTRSLIGRFNLLGSTDIEDSGIFVVKDPKKLHGSIPKGTPTFIPQLNSVMDAKGFFSPQNIVLMAPPKGFKTGTLLNLCKRWVMRGKKIYYADWDNGLSVMKMKTQQCFLNKTSEELKEQDHMHTLVQIMEKIGRMTGGELRLDEFQAKKDTMADVDSRLEYLKFEYGFEPDIIIYDYIDLAGVSDRTINDRREKIQHNYYEAVNINKRRGTFSITVSKVKQSAFKKDPIDLEDFGEDSEKAYNAHAAFALVSTPDEKKLGLARFQVVLQRQGLPPELAPQIPVFIDGGRLQMEPIDETMIAQVQNKKELQDLIRKANENNKLISEEEE